MRAFLPRIGAASNRPLCTAIAMVAAMGWQCVCAQYPTVPPAVQAEADARRSAADRRSDEAFARALPIIKEWEEKGKPYVPGAARPGDLPQAKIPSFPGAEGGGMFSFGGRGGKIFVVTNLNDNGPGSFREACEAGGPRIVVFNVGGMIRLKERIRVRAPYITIAGSTAPGDGVCIAGDTVEIDTHDVVIRHMRFRRGETWVGDRNDSLGGNPIGNIMIDHVSASWGLDECMSMYRHMYDHDNDAATPARKLATVNITIQHSIFSEALNTYNHSFGSTIGGYNTAFHHNLLAGNAGRNPSIGMTGDFNWFNNVLFNWRHRTMDGAGGANTVNAINNYFKPGPVTPATQPIGYRIVKIEAGRAVGGGPLRNFYVAGNIVEGNEKVTADNWAGGVQIMDADDAARDPAAAAAAEARLPGYRAVEPLRMPPVTMHNAKEAYEHVLANAGATLPKRDAVDDRVVRMVRTGEVTAKAGPDIEQELSVSGFQRQLISDIIERIPKGIITHPNQVGGYPEYKGTPYKDSDGDGMPDEWESQHGLDARDASDAAADSNGDGYTNIEDFINGLDPRAPKVDWTDLKNNVDRRNKA